MSDTGHMKWPTIIEAELGAVSVCNEGDGYYAEVFDTVEKLDALIVKLTDGRKVAFPDAPEQVLAPVMPTPEMRHAGEVAWMNRNLQDPDSDPIRDCYMAMVRTAEARRKHR